MSVLIRLLGLAAKGVAFGLEAIAEDRKDRQAGTGRYSPEEVAKREELRRQENSPEAVAERKEKRRLLEEKWAEESRRATAERRRRELCNDIKFMTCMSFPNQFEQNSMTANSAASMLGAVEAFRKLFDIPSDDPQSVEEVFDFMQEDYTKLFKWAEKACIFPGKVFNVKELTETQAFHMLCQAVKKLYKKPLILV